MWSLFLIAAHMGTCDWLSASANLIISDWASLWCSAIGPLASLFVGELAPWFFWWQSCPTGGARIGLLNKPSEPHCGLSFIAQTGALSDTQYLPASMLPRVGFFPLCPPHKKLLREKLPDYILGLAMSRLLKWCELLLCNQWWSGDPGTCSSDSLLEYKLRKGNSQEFHQKVWRKVPPNSSKKDRFWMVRPWHMQP